MSSRIVILISGSGTNLQAIIDACELADYPGSIVGVVSNKSEAFGLTRAKDADIETIALSHRDFESRESYDQALISKIDQFCPDVIVLAGFMRILTPAFVQHYQGKLLNIHPSLLPKYQGLNTHARVIKNKEKFSGCTVHFVTSKLDAGKIIMQEKPSRELLY